MPSIDQSKPAVVLSFPAEDQSPASSMILIEINNICCVNDVIEDNVVVILSYC